MKKVGHTPLERSALEYPELPELWNGRGRMGRPRRQDAG